jgi:hypothetical protein
MAACGFNNFDSVGELYSEDELGQLVVAIEATPVSLGGLAEFEDHGERGLIGKTSVGAHGGWRTVANELSMTLVVRRGFRCSSGKL